MSKEQNNQAVDLTTTTTKILAIGSLTANAGDPTKRTAVMTEEVPATVRLYLDGIIEQWWVKPDASGAVFLLNLSDKNKAAKIMEALPLGIAGMMDFELIPLAPLSPLRMLLNN
jgi:hypothetical protein